MKYWDPSASTVKKYTETYASELQSRGLTQDFTGLSTLLLGQAQPKQFQSANDAQPTGWYWGSKVSDDGTFTALDNPSADQMNNANAAMPRSLVLDEEAHYNYYAATAESVKYTTATYRVVSDSICPSGWRLPSSGEKGDEEKSFRNMLKTAYAFYSQQGTQQRSLIEPRKYPVSFKYTSINIAAGAPRHDAGVMWSNSTRTATKAGSLFISTGTIWEYGGDYFAMGGQVRCIQK